MTEIIFSRFDLVKLSMLQPYTQNQTANDIKPSIKASQMNLSTTNCSVDATHNVVYESGTRSQEPDPSTLSPTDDLSGTF